MKNRPLLLLPTLFLLAFCLETCTPSIYSRLVAESQSAYVGGYTRDEGWVNGKGKGVYRIELDKKGRITNQEVVAELINPSFVKESADGRYLLATSELSQPKERTGFIHVLDVRDGYREISKLPSGAQAPCHIELVGNQILMSNYNGGVASVYVQSPNGEITLTDEFKVPADFDARDKPHLHSANASPWGSLIAIADLGSDRIWLFTLAGGKLTPYAQPFVELAAGAGPRHATWSADGRFLYVINELNSTINVLSNDAAEKKMTVLQTISTLPEGWEGKNSTADIHLSRNGNFLYGSNRGHNSIVIYSVDKVTGKITFVDHESTRGKTPRNFAIAPTGRLLHVANQDSGNITTFTLNEKSGKLTFTGQDYQIGTPSCIEF
ncbi:lactonase family protein [Neolewinella agarilytica]|uniref:6-phosphogluconolactonase n=1 Tax=Neolewinella agarilytica TaxID=478744 RepID=A0A1H9M586_9BACT|nr:lactonase family protein [Neolewinella agarilytica]SER18822.1 6-phosphogluconolactonase [Neolewinella agarilytica]